MLLGLMNNDIINQMLQTIKTIVGSVHTIIASIDNYEGSEFCSGLLFGVNGTNLILSLGREIMEHKEKIEATMNEKLKK